MKSIKIFSLVAFFAAVALASTAFIDARLLKKVNVESKGFALIELYTSEGCSSCPPADELVAKIQKESSGKPVYILAYHVDYWNSLGWRDVFSSHEYSARQHEYARYLHSEQVYTPQIVVNGKTAFVGSEEGDLRNAIRINLEKAPADQLTLNVLNGTKSKVSLKYSIEGSDKNTTLMVAVLQKSGQTKVMSGENGGHTLSHVQIVRKLQQIALSGNNGTAIVALPAGYDAKSWEIIGFLQNTTSGAITGAARVANSEVSASL